jgi:hypothetical protein
MLYVIESPIPAKPMISPLSSPSQTRDARLLTWIPPVRSPLTSDHAIHRATSRTPMASGSSLRVWRYRTTVSETLT